MALRSRSKRIRNLPKMEGAKPKAKAKTRGERKIRTDNLKRVSKEKAVEKTRVQNAAKARANAAKPKMTASRTPDKITNTGKPMIAEKRVSPGRAKAVAKNARSAARVSKAANVAKSGVVGGVARAAGPVGAAVYMASKANELNKDAVNKNKGVSQTATTTGGRNWRNKKKANTWVSAAGPKKNPPKSSAPAKKSQSATTSNSFKSAFASARKAGQTEFTWKGNKYNTKLASDKKTIAEKTFPAGTMGAKPLKYWNGETVSTKRRPAPTLRPKASKPKYGK